MIAEKRKFFSFLFSSSQAQALGCCRLGSRMVTPDTRAALLLRPKAGTKLIHVQDDKIY